ncbi:hypothetical protein [Egbenema bharatensis]|uniref:hypothetical protein n=1 Tax=Egbenema bharatensis TaxID=3463334 RepID=UPI003A86C2EB
MQPLRIYDIDGTITVSGHDLWYLVTRSLSADPDSFDRAVAAWKADLKRGACPYESSRSMMQKGIDWIEQIYDKRHIKNRARELAHAIIQNNNYYPDAIQHITASIEAGFQVVFSTTNYHEGAEAVLEILVEHHLMKAHYIDRIICSGSMIDWKTRSILHFNMAEDKIAGISRILSIPIAELPKHTDSAYGDDPAGNDSGILSLGKRAFVIANPKNLEVALPETIIRTSWEDILRHHF